MKRRAFLSFLALAPIAPKLVALSAPCEAALVAYNDTIKIDQTKPSISFAKLTPEQRKIWSRDVWNHARENNFVSRFHGSDANAIIQGT